MKAIIDEHFRELLLCVMALIFGIMSMWTLSHHEEIEGFKWASGAVGTLLGALLMLMRGPSAETPIKSKPNVGQEEKK